MPPRRLRGVPSNINDMDSNSTQIFLKIQFETGDYDGSSATVNWRCFEIIWNHLNRFVCVCVWGVYSEYSGLVVAYPRHFFGWTGPETPLHVLDPISGPFGWQLERARSTCHAKATGSFLLFFFLFCCFVSILLLLWFIFIYIYVCVGVCGFTFLYGWVALAVWRETRTVGFAPRLQLKRRIYIVAINLRNKIVSI